MPQQLGQLHRLIVSQVLPTFQQTPPRVFQHLLVAITLEPSRLAAANVVDRLVHCEWNNHGKGASAIQLDAGKAIVEACTFAKKGTHVHVGKDAASCLAIGNQAQGGFHVENLSSERLQAVANEK